MIKNNNELTSRLKRIKLLAIDVDGVLTDGRIFFDAEGRESRAFHFLDIMGISRLKKKGLDVALISGEKNPMIDKLSQRLNIKKTIQDCKEKDKAINELVLYYKLKLENICFIGDDINDIPALKKVGLSVAVPNGWDGLKEHVHLITKKPGGWGAVREICELIISHRERKG